VSRAHPWSQMWYRLSPIRHDRSWITPMQTRGFVAFPSQQRLGLQGQCAQCNTLQALSVSKYWQYPGPPRARRSYALILVSATSLTTVKDSKGGCFSEQGKSVQAKEVRQDVDDDRISPSWDPRKQAFAPEAFGLRQMFLSVGGSGVSIMI
jgi:hypothetical protein